MTHGLKYLFTAFYEDGSVYSQEPDDKSTNGGGSAFSDVDHVRLSRFNIDGAGHRYGVNLKDGSFQINGVEFKMHSEDDQLENFKLIFWRRNYRLFNQALLEMEHVVKYRIGWLAKGPNGNVERVMEVS